MAHCTTKSESATGTENDAIFPYLKGAFYWRSLPTRDETKPFREIATANIKTFEVIFKAEEAFLG